MPNNGEVAILTTSESESDEDSVYTNINPDMPSSVSFSEVPGYTDGTHPTTCTDTPTFQYPVKEALHSDHITTEIPVSDTIHNAHSAATVSPQNNEDADKDDDVRKHVLETCTQLLLKLETVRLSVLHLQYSLHAGALVSSQIESIDRSSRLWTWDQSSKLGEVVPVEVSDPLKIPENEFHIEISDPFNLSDAALSELDVFGVPELLQELDPHLDPNAVNVPAADGATTEGCF